MAAQVFEMLLLENAEEIDRQCSPARIDLLQESYDFFKEVGLSEKEIEEVMALTPQQRDTLAVPHVIIDGSLGG